MQQESIDFLFKLLETPSVSGFEQRIQSVIKRRMSRYADTIEIDVHGNLIAARNPGGKVRVMLAGHCDQIGMMVKHIDDNGYILFNEVGGLDPAVLPGSRVTVHTKGGPIAGVLGHRPIHLLTATERGAKVELKKLWIDIGARDGREVREIVSIGDPVTYELGVTRLGKHMISSPGCDNRVGAFVVMEALRIAARELTKKSPVALFAASTVQEEIGLRGARTASYTINPLVGIAVDVTHASDNPGAEFKEIGTVKLGLGPTISRGPNINPVLENLLIDTAKKRRIPYQLLGAAGATGTDANVMQISRSGMATGLIGIPNRYMHSQVEVVDLRDLEAAAKLIAQTVLKITARMSFIPV